MHQPNTEGIETQEGVETQHRDRVRITLTDVHIEFLRHPDNWLFVGLCAVIAIALAISGPSLRDLAWFILGWLVFIPQEYFTHVHILHVKMPKAERWYPWLYRLHYGHHDLPRRHDLMYMPLWLTLPMTLANMALLWGITPEPRAFWASFCGALAGYIAFEWAHLLCHVPYVPKNALLRHARNLHLLHHFLSEKRWYAVTPSSLFMDRLMGSHGRRDDTARSDTCRYLGLQPEHEWIAKARARFAARSSGDLESSRLWLLNAGSRD